MIEILNCSTGNSVVDLGGNRIQDHSYIASGKINVKIVDNHTNIVFLESFFRFKQTKNNSTLFGNTINWKCWY